MKISIVIVAAIVLIAGAATAQLPPQGYIGLFTDEAHTTWCVTGTPFYSFDMYIYCLPSDQGMICAEFAISYPTNLIQSTVTPSDSISVALGSLPDGMSACVLNCQWDWIWIFKQFLVVNAADKTHLEIIKHPDPLIPAIQFANCNPGYPEEPVVVFTNLYINYNAAEPECGEPGTKSSTWGAIKSMYRE
ncbi:MAG: hypothetical protein JSV33_07450 [bacterium]|nr:MAG: hypothetical protein JSV33_07450 [bacterium]